MNRFKTAEWILSLVTSRERAASTVGDLTERGEPRGTLWFWSGVLRTAASLLWRDITEHPVRVAGLALVGAAVDFAGLLLFAAFSGIVFFFVAFWLGGDALKAPVWKLWVPSFTLIASLLIGRSLSRLAPGREFAVCLIYVILAPACGLLDFSPANFAGLVLGLLGDAALRMPALAGAVWGRYRNSARTSG